MKIIQITEALTDGDGISNDVVEIDKLLKKSGIFTHIFSCNENNIFNGYRDICSPISELGNCNDCDLILFHHGIKNDFIYKLKELKCKKCLIYHNITPSYFFKFYDSNLYKSSKIGIRQTIECKNFFDFCIADSEFNKSDLIKYGYTCPIFVCPIIANYKKLLELNTNNKIYKLFNDGWVNIIFVGRVSLHKKQDDVIHSYAIYKKNYNVRCRLFLIGSGENERYGKDLKCYCAQYNIKDVYFVGKVSDSDLITYYKLADLFVCMSEHEGFCIPIVEAMQFNIPIIAFNCSAIPFTLKDSGILISSKNFNFIAKKIDEIISNKYFKDVIIEKQNRRLIDFNYEKVCEEFLNIIHRSSKEYTEENQCITFDLVVPVKNSDLTIFKKNLRFIEDNINPRKVIIITNTKNKFNFSCEYGNVCFVDEDNVIPGLTFNNLLETLNKNGSKKEFCGQWFQLLLKLAYAKICKNEYYLTWDADTIPLNKLSFFDNKTKKPYFTLKKEYVKPYFDSNKAILNIDKIRKESYISEHMIFKKDFVIEMLDVIEKNHHLKGRNFWEKIIFNSPRCSYQNPYFSEFESYGNYVDLKYPNFYLKRKLRTLRCAKDFLGSNPSDEVLEWVKEDFDTISIEHWNGIIESSFFLVNNYIIRKNFSFRDIVINQLNNIKISACLGNQKYIEKYNDLYKKIGFDDFFDEFLKYTKQND